MGVLTGFKVVELGVWVAGPSAAGLMADWGADVVKLESPDGDPFRHLFGSLGYRPDVPNAPFALDNRGKRSLALDLRRPEAAAVSDRLLDTADVLVTNMRPAALERLGLDAASVSVRHPRLIYAGMSGYGRTGPDRDRPGYDLGAFWARSGMAAGLTPNDHPPPAIRGGMGDHAAALAALSGILAALLERERTGTGKVLDVSLLRTGAFLMGWDLGIVLAVGRTAPTVERDESGTPLLNSYRTADGKWLFLIGLESDRHFPSLCRAVGRLDLLDDPRFARAGERRRHSRELIAELDAAFAQAPMSEWAKRLGAEDVWWEPVQRFEDVVTDPQLVSQGCFVDIEWPNGERGRSVAPPVRFDDSGAVPRVPLVGEHTSQVLAECGLAPQQIDRLVRQGVVHQSNP